MIVPNAVIILVPQAGCGWLPGGLRPWAPAKQSRTLRRPLQPISTFDRRALRQRVERLLRQNKEQRDHLRAAAWQ